VAFDRVISAAPVFQTFICEMPGLPLFIFMHILGMKSKSVHASIALNSKTVGN